MRHSQRSPLSHLALSQFGKSFGDLIKAKTTITLWDDVILKTIFEAIMWFGRTKQDYVNFERSARAAYYFIKQGNQANPREIARLFYSIVNEIVPAFNDCRQAANEAERVAASDADAKIRKYLDYYKVMYEGIVPYVYAPVCYAFSIAKHITDKDFIPGADGKLNLYAIDKMGKALVYKENRLSIGLNGHIRNAYVHESYKILDGARVELCDINRYRPKKSWGPEIWTLEQLVILCDQLWVNILGVICALVIYDINNRSVAEKHGWVPPMKCAALRENEISTTVEYVADEFGFYFKKLDLLPEGVSIVLTAKPKGIDQESKLTLGGENVVTLIKIPIWYEERRIIDQLVSMLYQLTPYFALQSGVRVSVLSLADKRLGILVTNFRTISGLRLENNRPETIDKIRHLFTIDTLKEHTTFIEKKGTPKYMGTVPVKTKDQKRRTSG